MDINFLSFLRNNTGHNWIWLNPLQLSYYLNKESILCVVTPDELALLKYNKPINSLRSPFYIPLNPTHIHSPEQFVKRYLPIERQLLKEWPAITIELEKWPNQIKLIKLYGNIIIYLLISPTGSLTLRKLGSINDLAITTDTFKMIKLDATTITEHYFNNFFLKYYGPTNNKMTIGNHLSSDEWSYDLSLIPGYPIEFTGATSPHTIDIDLHGWNIEGELGLKVDGKIFSKPTYELSYLNFQPSTNDTNDSTSEADIMGITATTLLMARFLFIVAL